MASTLTIDGHRFKVGETSIERTFEIAEGENSGMSINKNVLRDIIGTVYAYEMTIQTMGMAVEDYDALYEILSAPDDRHVITVPYGQGTLTYEAYIKSGEDTLRASRSKTNLWGGLSVRFLAARPQRMAGTV